MQPNKTSWEGVHDWYSNLVGKQGHFYHQHVIIPKTLELLGLSKEKTAILLDLACGQGVLARNLPETVEYWGVDLSPSLIREAKKLTPKKGFHFYVGDVTKKLNLPLEKVDIVTLILAIQDLAEPEGAIAQACHFLEKGGRFLIVMNHPCFRIPRQSEWGVDEAKKLQYRRINGYIRSQSIPIQTSPGKREKSPAVSYFHHPLKDYSQWLKKHGFGIELIDEWISEKKSEGAKKRMEDRARAEFPLFLCILARKL